MPRAKANSDFNARQFRETCRDEGFAWLGGTAQRFIDLRFHVPGRTILPIRNKSGQILHAETLAALRASRAASEQEKQRAEAKASEQVACAARIAPQAMPPARAGLAEAEAISVLADDFRTINARDQGVRRSDLLQLGWTPAQLERYGRLAARTAYQLEGAM